MNELSLKYFPLKTSTWSLTCCQSNSHSIQYHVVCLILYGIWIFDCRHNLANRQIMIVVMVAQIFTPRDEVSSSVLFWETHSVSGTVRKKKKLNFCCFQLCSGLFFFFLGRAAFQSPSSLWWCECVQCLWDMRVFESWQTHADWTTSYSLALS